LNAGGSLSVAWWLRDERGEWQPWMKNRFTRVEDWSGEPSPPLLATKCPSLRPATLFGWTPERSSLGIAINLSGTLHHEVITVARPFPCAGDGRKVITKVTLNDIFDRLSFSQN
jgi:hypothetical protein